VPTFVFSTDRPTDLDVDVLVLPVFEGPEAGPGVKDVRGIDLLGLFSAAGSKGKRYCLPNSRLMIHQPMGGFQGQASDVEIHAKEILYLRAKLNEIMAKHTGQPVERIGRDTDRDNFLSAEDAMQYGLVDKILTSRDEATVV